MAQSKEAMVTTLFQRFGLGAKPGSRNAFSDDPKGAALAELSHPERALIQDEKLYTARAALDISYTQQRELRDRRQTEEREKKTNPASENNPAMLSEGATRPPMMEMGKERPARSPAPQNTRREQEIRRSEVQARLRQGFLAEIGLAERLVLFWSNHFAVSGQKGPQLQATVGAFEREAIRPHILGRFEDMLLAVEKHPAMLIFLDNRQSIGPNSRAGVNRQKGLNENLAREILELHTLGVHGGYTQQDVTSLARIITGWTVVGPEGELGDPGDFRFFKGAHEPGDHTLLGRIYKEGGLEQGETALRDLAQHPSTAKFIARKLVSHFIADDPPATLVTRLEKIFLETRGDLAAVTRALVGAEEAWSLPPRKIRTPYEFVMASARALNTLPDNPGLLQQALGALGQQLWLPQGPNGYPDSIAALVAPEAMKTRLDVAAIIGKRMGNTINPTELAGTLYGRTLSDETRSAIARAETKTQGLAILMMSPEFQKR